MGAHFVGIRPVHSTIMGGIDESNSHGPHYLARMEEMGRKAR